jgi:hypothetical protein
MLRKRAASKLTFAVLDESIAQRVGDTARVGAAEPTAVLSISDNHFRAAERPALDDRHSVTFFAQTIEGQLIQAFFDTQ